VIDINLLIFHSDSRPYVVYCRTASIPKYRRRLANFVAAGLTVASLQTQIMAGSWFVWA